MTPQDTVTTTPERARSNGAGAAPSGRLPADPEAFVAAAERITNERAAQEVRPLYARDAEFVSIADGAVTRATGREEIARTWELLFAFLAARDFRLRKRLLVAADGMIVNEWTGSLGGRTHALGIECWRFDADGLIAQHTLYSYLNTRAASSMLQRLRLLVAYPRTALAYLRAELRASRGRSS